MRTPPWSREHAGRIETALERALSGLERGGCPPKLAAALHHAVFPGGGRVRPQLCLAAARALGAPSPDLSDAGAAAVELIHCASLVHDDLPCFDDAPTRRGQPTVHRVWGEPVAVLAGDALIVLAFDVLGQAAAAHPAEAGRVLAALARGVGAPWGIIAGQAWECEDAVEVARYHRAKTGALFAAAAELGALSAGANPQAWRVVGEQLGRAYQVADDLADATGEAHRLGKPVGQDGEHQRPNAARELGVRGARALLDRLVSDAVAALPPHALGEDFRAWLLGACERLLSPEARAALDADPPETPDPSDPPDPPDASERAPGP